MTIDDQAFARLHTLAEILGVSIDQLASGFLIAYAEGWAEKLCAALRPQEDSDA